LIPLLSVIAVWCFYGLVRKVFSDRVALIAAGLLFIQPAFWYYASRGLLPNVLFVDLLIIGAWLIKAALSSQLIADSSRFPNTNSSLTVYFYYLLGGLFVGLALTVRTAEIFWVGLVILGLIIIYRRRLDWLGVALFLVGLALTFVPILFFNQQLYGDYLNSGYSPLSATDSPVLAGVSARSSILPFGLHPRTALNNFWQYYVKMLWWYFIPLVAGLVLILIKLLRGSQLIALSSQRNNKLNYWVYLSILALVSGWLIIYYGSWSVKDNISGHYTIGTSYLRYWLPAFILGLPLISWLFDEIFFRIKKNWLKIVVGILLGGLFLILSANLVWRSEEGLAQIAATTYGYKITNQLARQNLGSDSIIITDRSDKVFWPELRTAVFGGDFTVFERLSKVLELSPVYYYSHNQLTAENLEYLNENLEKLGVGLERWGSLNGEDELYKLVKN
jgi:4-amino-4-deoxy-L-arabinose transferase-like glycosyltransferase